ncbi:hypothetical protein O3P69_019860 [Scylla paramamosain]|uniref:Uncharacterized protein n=1 Tax=Scylla paramamosain TaxID=85552 RepID=A0AAW0SG89_SCYPA
MVRKNTLNLSLVTSLLGQESEIRRVYRVAGQVTLDDCVGDRTLAGRGDVALDIQSEGDWQKTQRNDCTSSARQAWPG